MKILYYDCFAGISGDMNLAAMIDLGIQPEYLQTELSKLSINDEFIFDISQAERRGIHGTQVTILLQKERAHHLHHSHRNLGDIEKIIVNSDLDKQVQQTSLAIFRRIAHAEAKIHGKAVHEVRFHEVGATDSIVDIVGAALCFHALQIDQVWSSPIELGGGLIHCAHGLMPVPAPATLEILANIPTRSGAVQEESTTPTGAAILAELVDRFESAPAFILQKTAYGIGHRNPEIPNVLRVSLAQTEDMANPFKTTPACLLECNIDDMSGEMLGDAMEHLMKEGAMDVHFTPIVMKKSRPAVTLSVLCDAKEETRFKHLIFRNTSTLGIKTFPIKKTTLDISFEKIETPLGPLTMKNAILNGKIIRSKPEIEDCQKLAATHDIPLHEVYLQLGKVRKF